MATIIAKLALELSKSDSFLIKLIDLLKEPLSHLH